MSSQQQWDEAYAIAEKLFNAKKPVLRESLDELAQIVCARYETVFRYDPYKDTYSFRDQRLRHDNPVPPRCRRICDIDLDALKKGTQAAEIVTPSYAQLLPLYAVLPSTVLVFNLSQKRALGLSRILEAAYNTLTSQPTVLDVFPGADFIFKHHETRKCYRVIVLEELTQSDGGEHAYRVIFADTCQTVSMKLHKLFMRLPELSFERYPPLLQCARYVGVATLRAGYLETMSDELSALYADRPRRKAGLPAVIYKRDEDGKLVVDFASVKGQPCMESAAFQALRGHLSVARDDPKGINYEQLTSKVDLSVVVDFQHQRLRRSLLGESFMDLDESTVTSTPSVVHMEECSTGMSGLAKYLSQQKVEEEQETIPESMRDYSLDESVSLTSARSSRARTPNPTYDEPINSEREKTPKKKESVEEEPPFCFRSTSDALPTGSGSGFGGRLPTGFGFGTQTFGSQLFGTQVPSLMSLPLRSDSGDDGRAPSTSRTVQRPLMLIKQKIEAAKAEALQKEKEAAGTVVVVDTPKKHNNLNAVVVPSEESINNLNVSSPETTRANNTFTSLPELIAAEGEKESDREETPVPEINLETHEAEDAEVLSIGIGETRCLSDRPPTPKPLASLAVSYEDEEKEEEKEEEEEETKEEVTVEEENVVEVVIPVEPVEPVLVEESVQTDAEELIDKDAKLHQDIIAETVESIVSDVSSNRSDSNCATDISEQIRIVENEIEAPPIDQYSLVPEFLKTLAISFLSSCENAVTENNRVVFAVELMSMESVSRKLEGVEQRFWRMKIMEAKGLESSFE